MANPDSRSAEALTFRQLAPLALGWGLPTAVAFAGVMVPIMRRLGADIPFVPLLFVAILGFGIGGFVVADAVLGRRGRETPR